MYRLFHAELSRRLVSLLYLGELLCLLILDVTLIIFLSYGFDVDTGYFLFGHLPLICIFTAANASIWIGQEMDHRTINNKLFCGFSKVDFFHTEILVAVIESVLLLIFDTACILLLTYIKGYPAVISRQFFIHLCILLISTGTISVLSTVAAILIRYGILSILFVIGATLLLLICGQKTVDRLNQPARTDLFNEEHVLQENPLYVDGRQRTADNLHLCLSPYAQSTYATFLIDESSADKYLHSLFFKSAPFHIDFVLADLGLCLLFSLLGRRRFYRQDLM